ncbi:MAG TPA: GAF domain-containing sensor histidine kinase [Kouleothrix sp.]|nr:GAF domain-containing sensor histidine kinase [Kouleothrix sp.]
MKHANDSIAPSEELRWRLPLQLRWPLGAAITLAFAAGQLAEALLLGEARSAMRLVMDVVAWGLLGGIAVWVSLTWVSRRERHYQSALERALDEQQALNIQLQRANSQLELLSDVNRQLAESATLDEILDAALAFPQRLVPIRGAALLLYDPSGPIVARTVGSTPAMIAEWRAQVAAMPASEARTPRLFTGDPMACLLVPLHDGVAPVGRLELYIEHPSSLAADELELLETIGSEVAEAIVGARRRARETRAIYQLEQAIAEERARIARDIHDGLAQTIAFQRMRVDLWLDWVSTDPDRLRTELRAFKQSLRTQIVELRRAIFALRPVQFDELGFAGGLNRYIKEFGGQQSWDMQIDLSGLPSPLAPELEATCFRIVQEALTNVAKHAAATQVIVQIDQIDHGLRIRVSDNGRGFEPTDVASAPDRVGLRQMRERLAALRGQITILSRPGAGTELRVWLPLGRSRPDLSENPSK